MRQKPTLWRAMPLLYCSAALLTLPVSAAYAQSTQEQKQPAAQSQPQTPAATPSQAPAQPEQKSGATQGQAPASAPTTAQQPAKQDQKAQSPKADTKQQQTQSPASDKKAQSPKTDAKQQQTESPAKSGTQTTQTPKSGTTTSQDAQKPSATGTQTTQTPAQPSATGQATGQPSGTTTAALSDQQRSSISTSIQQANVQPLRNANFSISVGTVIPTSVRYYPVTPAIIAVYPQYRGYSFVVVEEEIIIIEPRTRKIVQVIEYKGGGRTVATTRSKLKLTDKQRNVIRTSVRRGPATTGLAAAEKEITIGDSLPESIVIERFPDTVYRSVPSMRSYQYIARDRGIYIVDPRERRVIDLID